MPIAQNRRCMRQNARWVKETLCFNRNVLNVYLTSKRAEGKERKTSEKDKTERKERKKRGKEKCERK